MRDVRGSLRTRCSSSSSSSGGEGRYRLRRAVVGPFELRVHCLDTLTPDDAVRPARNPNFRNSLLIICYFCGICITILCRAGRAARWSRSDRFHGSPAVVTLLLRWIGEQDIVKNLSWREMQVWPAAEALARYLATGPEGASLRGQSVLELGAGVGGSFASL
jgi:hypothetical protein